MGTLQWQGVCCRVSPGVMVIPATLQSHVQASASVGCFINSSLLPRLHLFCAAGNQGAPLLSCGKVGEKRRGEREVVGRTCSLSGWGIISIQATGLVISEKLTHC